MRTGRGIIVRDVCTILHARAWPFPRINLLIMYLRRLSLSLFNSNNILLTFRNNILSKKRQVPLTRVIRDV